MLIRLEAAVCAGGVFLTNHDTHSVLSCRDQSVTEQVPWPKAADFLELLDFSG